MREYVARVYGFQAFALIPAHNYPLQFTYYCIFLKSKNESLGKNKENLEAQRSA